jgi:hypothetical protein
MEIAGPMSREMSRAPPKAAKNVILPGEEGSVTCINYYGNLPGKGVIAFFASMRVAF